MKLVDGKQSRAWKNKTDESLKLFPFRLHYRLFALMTRKLSAAENKFQRNSPLLFALAIGRTDSPPKFHSRPQSHRHFLSVICVQTRCCSIDCPAWQRLLLISPAAFNLQLYPLERGLFNVGKSFFHNKNSLHQRFCFLSLYCFLFFSSIDNFSFFFILLLTFSSRTTFVLLAWFLPDVVLFGNNTFQPESTRIVVV